MQELIYKTEKKADEAMEIYAPLLIECSEDIIYVGVFKKDKKFEIKIGTKDGKSISKNQLINCLRNKKIGSHRLLERDEDYFNKLFIFDKLKSYEVEEFKLISPNKTRKKIEPSLCLKGGISIGNKYKSGGTLGAVFQLEEFPNEYFGISNWHVLAFGNKLGGDIIQPSKNNYGTAMSSKYECGYLFWRCLDEQREVAFVHFDKLDRFDNHHKVTRTNYCNNKLSANIISVPNIGEKLKKCNYFNKKEKEKEILSRNITVKVYDTRFKSDTGKNTLIFKNQILLDGSFNNGNSGSILTFKNSNGTHDAVGLLFGNTINSKLGLANKLNDIFKIPLNQFGIEYSKLHYKKGQSIKVNKFTPKIIF